VKKILVIDDSWTVREQVRMALTSAGYETIEAVDGIDGLQKLTADNSIALCLCDVNMPRMNGLELLEQIKRSGRLGNMPFLVLTSEGQPALVDRARKSGAKAWIVKPFQPNMLLAAVRKVLGA
jgi:two-component system chemotaxis response regulator CheY